MRYPKEKELQALREKYPAGTVIRCLHMDDPQAVPPGTKGKVDYVDDAGTIHMIWENGSGLGLIPGQDRFVKV